MIQPLGLQLFLVSLSVGDYQETLFLYGNAQETSFHLEEETLTRSSLHWHYRFSFSLFQSSLEPSSYKNSSWSETHPGIFTISKYDIADFLFLEKEKWKILQTRAISSMTNAARSAGRNWEEHRQKLTDAVIHALPTFTPVKYPSFIIID